MEYILTSTGSSNSKWRIDLWKKREIYWEWICNNRKITNASFNGLILKRNEYFVIWRDTNYLAKNNYSKFLENVKMILYKNEGINVYIESCTENALDLIKRKKYNKIILISNIGLYLSGKKFVETARKISSATL